MNAAVALTETYLRLNGYLTAVEYPIVRMERRGQAHSATDLDVLAIRFPGADGGVADGRPGSLLGPTVAHLDPALGAPTDTPDMIVGEVKSGRARFNPTAADRGVLAAALARFGCCDREKVSDVALELLRHGRARTAAGHAIRLVAFGTEAPGKPRRHHVVTLGRMIEFLRLHIRVRDHMMARAQIMDPVLDLLVLLEKSTAPGRTGSMDASGRKAPVPRGRRP